MRITVVQGHSYENFYTQFFLTKISRFTVLGATVFTGALVDSKIDLRTKYSLSRVSSKDLEVAIVIAWLIASRHRRSDRLPYGRHAFQILELLYPRCHVRQRVGMAHQLTWVWSIMYRALSIPNI